MITWSEGRSDPSRAVWVLLFRLGAPGHSDRDFLMEPNLQLCLNINTCTDGVSPGTGLNSAQPDGKKMPPNTPQVRFPMRKIEIVTRGCHTLSQCLLFVFLETATSSTPRWIALRSIRKFSFSSFVVTKTINILVCMESIHLSPTVATPWRNQFEELT